jgi:hypothetical protein
VGRTSLAERVKRSRTQLTPASMLEQRSAAVEQMNKATLDKLRQFETLGSNQRENNIRHYYAVGKLYIEMRDNPAKYEGRDGTSGVRLIEKALSLQARVLRKAATFVDMYTEAAVNKLVGAYNRETNFQLHWGHVTYLLTVEDKEKREEFAKEAVMKMLDPPALHALIKKRQRRAGGHGRRHELPATPAAQLRQIQSTTTVWNNKAEQVWDGDEVSVLSNLMKLAPDQIDEDMVIHLKETEDQLRAAAEKSLAMADKVSRIREHVMGKLKERREQEAEIARNAASGGRESRSIDLGDKPRRRAS